MEAIRELQATTEAADHRTDATEAVTQRRRFGNLAPLRPGEAEHLTADFLATRGVTVCPARYAAPIWQRQLPVRAEC